MLYIGLPKYGEATGEGEATERPACVTALWQQQSGNKSGHFIFLLGRGDHPINLIT